jgi:hypothetical protein
MPKIQPSILFHGTGILQLAQILAQDRMEASEPDDHDRNGFSGVSLTSDLDVALKFAGEAKDRDWDGQWRSPVEDGVVISLDVERLSLMAGFRNVTWDGSAAEAEYRTFGDIPSVRSAINRITIDVPSCRWWIDALREDGMEDEAACLEQLQLDLIDVHDGEAIGLASDSTLADLLDRIGTSPSPAP